MGAGGSCLSFSKFLLPRIRARGLREPAELATEGEATREDWFCWVLRANCLRCTRLPVSRRVPVRSFCATEGECHAAFWLGDEFQEGVEGEPVGVFWQGEVELQLFEGAENWAVFPLAGAVTPDVNSASVRGLAAEYNGTPGKAGDAWSVSPHFFSLRAMRLLFFFFLGLFGLVAISFEEDFTGGIGTVGTRCRSSSARL